MHYITIYMMFFCLILCGHWSTGVVKIPTARWQQRGTVVVESHHTTTAEEENGDAPASPLPIGRRQWRFLLRNALFSVGASDSSWRMLRRLYVIHARQRQTHRSFVPVPSFHLPADNKPPRWLSAAITRTRWTVGRRGAGRWLWSPASLDR